MLQIKLLLLTDKYIVIPNTLPSVGSLCRQSKSGFPYQITDSLRMFEQQFIPINEQVSLLHTI